MPTFGSSVINKSNKKLAPKVPSQRRRPADQLPRYNTPQVSEISSVQASSQLQAEDSIADVYAGNDAIQHYDRAAGKAKPVNSGEPAAKRQRLRPPTARLSGQRDGIQHEPGFVEGSMRSSSRTDAHERLNHSWHLNGIEQQDMHPTSGNSAASTTRSRRAGSQTPSARELIRAASVANTESQVARRTRSQVAATRRDHEVNGGFDVPQPSRGIGEAPSTKKGQKAERRAGSQVQVETNEISQPEVFNARTGRNKGRKRARTPPGAEEIQIDPSSVRMADLGKDTRTGRKSRLETAFQSIDWSEVVKKRKEAEASALLAAESDFPAQAATFSVDTQLQEADHVARSSQNRIPQLKLVNGEMIIDNSSLMIDRHADAANAAASLPAEEANDLTARVNTRSWIYDNRRDPKERHRLTNKSDPWTASQTSAFYDALRMFGTDFYIISKMFPGKTRRHIKLKFVREERADPTRVADALVGGTVPMNLERYCEATGKEREFYKDPEAIAEDLRKEEEEQRAEIERQRGEAARAARERKEEARRAKEAKAARGRGKRAKGPVGKSIKVTVDGEEITDAISVPSRAG